MTDKENKDLLEGNVDDLLDVDSFVEGEVKPSFSEPLELDETFSESLILDNAEYSSEIGKKANEIKKSLEMKAQIPTGTSTLFKDVDGAPLPERVEGSIYVTAIPMEKLIFVGSEETQVRDNYGDVFKLERSIQQFGLLNPIHVVPLGEPVGNSDNGLPIYESYGILHGKRRFRACMNVGLSQILAIVDESVPAELIEVYQSVAHTSKDLSFTEKVEFGEYLKQIQPYLDYELIEDMLGYGTGEFLKAIQINQFKVDFPGIFKDVENKKITIDQAFKKLEKEIDKAENPVDEDEEIDQQDIEDALRGKSGDELLDLQTEAHRQKAGEREILDPIVRRTVENRDGGYCQCCNYGIGEEDLMGVFRVHHIVAVQYGGSDSKENLILLCQNCHQLVHDYESGKFNPSIEFYNRAVYIKKIVTLGNILRDARKTAIATIKSKDPNAYRVMNRGGRSLGKTLLKVGIDLDLENKKYDGSPYQKFVDVTRDLDVGGSVSGDLGELEQFTDYTYKVDDENTDKDLPEPNLQMDGNLTAMGNVASQPSDVENKNQGIDKEELSSTNDLEILSGTDIDNIDAEIPKSMDREQWEILEELDENEDSVYNLDEFVD